MGMSFTEKSVWVQMAATILGLVVYAALAVPMVVGGVDELGRYLPLLAGAIVLVIAVNIAGHVVAVMAGGEEPADERDRVIRQRAELKSGVLVRALVVIALLALAASLSGVLVAHLLLLTLFGGELTSLGYRLVDYRRGM